MSRCQELLRTGWCAQCYSGKKGRAAYRGHWGYRAPRDASQKVRATVGMKKPVGGVREGGVLRLEGDELMHDFPRLWEYLTETEWEDKSQRETATLLIFVEDGAFKACLNDRAMGRTGWTSAGTFLGLLEALETGLEEDSLDWRKKAGNGKRGGR